MVKIKLLLIHTTHFIYIYDIGLAERNLLCGPSHIQNSRYDAVYYTRCEVLVGTRLF